MPPHTRRQHHVLRGVALGIAQVNNGTKAPLLRMNEADGFVYYSPKESYPDGEPLREFTAIGRIADGDVYQSSDGPMMTGQNGDFVGKWMAFAMPYMVGPMFEEGLLDLKNKVEAK